MKFTQKDELGLERTYYVVTQLELGGEEYIIYSDLLKDEQRDYRLLVGKNINGKVIRIDKALRKLRHPSRSKKLRDYMN